jgi:phosphatidate cytidylyltransferase
MWDIIKSSSVRIKTSFIMLGVVLLVGFLNSYFVTWAVLGLLMLIGLKEMQTLTKIDENKLYIYAGVVWLASYFYPNPQDLVFLVFIAFASILAYTQNFDKRFFIPMLYPLIPFLFILALYKDFGMFVLLWLMLVVSATDVGAYFAGRRLGKTKFCETSPNKTLEGVAGGIILGTLVGLAFLFLDISVWIILLASFLVSIVSVFGDLFESYLKRMADVKDSGDIFPGHGGVLDRGDGYFFGAIVMYILLKALV